MKLWFNGYFPWIGYVDSFRIVQTSPMSKWKWKIMGRLATKGVVLK